MEEKLQYCNSRTEMQSCPRLIVFKTVLEAQRGNTSVSNVNNNANYNTNNNSTNLNLNVKETFELARLMVEGKRGISEDEKVEIYARISMLERELGKDKTQIDKSKIERIKQGFEKYSWLIPIVADIIKKGLGA
jgi:hypothetical protein